MSIRLPDKGFYEALVLDKHNATVLSDFLTDGSTVESYTVTASGSVVVFRRTSSGSFLIEVKSK